mgnify:CR=1 FL=1
MSSSVRNVWPLIVSGFIALIVFPIIACSCGFIVLLIGIVAISFSL